MSLGRIGVIGRFKPVHLGAAVMLESLCEQASHVLIGIGSSNKYDVRNPFTPEETKGMVDAFLFPRFSNYETLFIPDYGHLPGCDDGQKWRKHILSTFGPLDAFVTGNAYTKELLAPDYAIIHPSTMVPRHKWVYLRATGVRVEMAKGNEWEHLVPEPVRDYLVSQGLVGRFRREFGLPTLVELLDPTYERPETVEEEREHTINGGKTMCGGRP